MQKAKGKNQSMVRQINQRLVVDLLARGSKSCTDIAKELNLSNTAVAKIISELRGQNFVCLDESEPVSGELGRKPILFRLNGAFAMTAVVDVCDNSVLLANMSGTILAARNLGKVESYNEKTIGQLVEALQKLCESFAGLRLIAICAVTSGILDSVTGEYIFANRFENYRGLSLQAIFKSAFHVPVTVVNDTRVALIAERNYGLLARATNAVFLNIDTGIACALLINGTGYLGDKGFAGEAGLLSVGSGKTLEEIASLDAIKQKVKQAVKEGKCSLSGDSLHTADIVSAFHGGDEAVREIVLESAQQIAEIVRNMVHILDCRVVISGRVTEFGNAYLDVVSNWLKTCEYLDVKVQFSTLSKQQAARLGAIKVAVEFGFDSVLRK